MSQPTIYTFVTAVMSKHSTEEDWQGTVQRALASRGYVLADDRDGSILRDGQLVGWYRFIELPEATARFGSCAWFSLAEQEWTGRPAGFLNFSTILDSDEFCQSFLPKVIDTCRGVIARTDDGRSVQPVRPRAFTLANLVWRHGFGDGDDLLSHDADYQLYLQEAASAALHAAGLDGDIGFQDTHHNPLILAGDLRKGGAPISDGDAESLLRTVTATLWAFDWDVLRQSTFWIE